VCTFPVLKFKKHAKYFELMLDIGFVTEYNIQEDVVVSTACFAKKFT